ncbi:MAG: type III secretion system chaperone [Sulfitobacter sp.]|nr:type III secretion system chaperone [Sulfitobacter sp.]
MMNPIDLIGGWLRTMLGVERFEGHSAFLYDGRIELSVDLVDGDETILLQALAGPVPDTGREAFYEGLLAASHPSNGLRGCALSVDEARDNVVIWYQYPVSALEIDRFQDILTGFVGQADTLTERLRSGVGTGNDPLGEERGGRQPQDTLDPRMIRP